MAILKLAFVVIFCAIASDDQVFAQALDLRDGTANIQPVVFDFEGGKHACAHGYYGTPVPPISDPSTHLLARGNQDVSFRSAFDSFLALEFSSVVGTCQRSR
jgi:hypothetical protein